MAAMRSRLVTAVPPDVGQQDRRVARAERPGRALHLYQTFAERYRRVGDAILRVEAAVAAVSRVRVLDRPRIRAIAVERFGVDRMIDEYVAVYQQVIADARHA